MATKPKTVDEYLAALGDEQRAALERLRKSIRAAAPNARECISYGLPAFRLDQKPLVAFGATAKHCAFYLMSGSIVERHQDELKNYDTSNGTISFQPDKPLSPALVGKLVLARITENRQPTPKQPTQNHVHYHKDGTVWAKGMTGSPTTSMARSTKRRRSNPSQEKPEPDLAPVVPAMAFCGHRQTTGTMKI